MAHGTPQPAQKIIPYLAYEDAAAALDFLRDAFGFEERSRLPMPDGRIGHAEVMLGSNVLMLASAYAEMGLASPRRLGAVHCQLFCYVDDVDAHHERALNAGAVIVNEPEDQHYGDRVYRAMDPEGHRWMFATRLSPD